MSGQSPSAHRDAELLEAWRTGKAEAGQELFKRHYPTLERFLLNKVDSDQVVDLVQETFLACVKRRDEIRESGRFRSYLLGVAYRVFCRYLRQRYQDNALLDPEKVCLRDLDPSQSSLIARTSEQRLLLEGLRSISVNYQTVLELHYWEDLTTTEIAEVLDIPNGTVRSRLQRARDALEAAMANISRSPDVLESTVTRLDDWAERCNQELLRAPREH